MRRAVLMSMFLLGCNGQMKDGAVDSANDSDPQALAETDVALDTDAGSDPGEVWDDALAPLGFIGSPCTTDDDCDFDGGVCLTEGYPNGMCSQACDRTCPDRSGTPVTFCVTGDDLPDAARDLGDGACHSRCDFGIYPQTGCRGGYGCAATSRANEASTENYACLPERDSELPDCYGDLAARGVAFEPTIVAETSPSSHPNLTCSVRDALYLKSPVLGVTLESGSGEETRRVLAACEMGHAIADTVEDVLPLGVVSIQHYGSYVCRVIAGSNSLSRHGYGDALDIAGFGFDDDRVANLYDHWEHDTTSPTTWAGSFLYDASYRWHEAAYWNIILTPNYNTAHDDHFHVDLTPGSDYIGATHGRYLGPASTDDCGGPAWHTEPDVDARGW